MNKNIILTAAVAGMTFMTSATVTAQSQVQLPAAGRKAGPVELKAVPEAARPVGKLSKPLKASQTPATDVTVPFYGRTLYGALINSTEWTDVSIAAVPYGIYSFETGTSPTTRKHIESLSYNFVSGAYYRGKFFGISQMSVMGALNGARYITIDTDNWTEVKNVMYYTSKKSYSLLPAAMAYNPVDDNIYAFQYKDDLSGLDWCKYNPEFDEMDKIASFRGKYNVLALAAKPDGGMYFINSYGDLYKINKATGRATFIEWTGVTPILYSQSMMWDNRTGTFLWAAQTENGSILYSVNPETAEATGIIPFKNSEQFSAIYALENGAKDGAPAQVENLGLAYSTGGSLEGTISFDVPTTTFGGSLLGKATLDVWLDGVNIKSEDAVPGSKVSIPVSLTEGNHYVNVSLSNDEGRSPLAYVYQYAGYDVPKAVKEVAFSHDGGTGLNNLSWAAPEGGENGGFIDFDNLTYTIVRMPDSVTVAEGHKGLSFSEPVPNAMHNYSYRVYAVNNGKRSAYTESNKVICGNAFTVPYSQLFSDPTVLTDFYTIVDADEDGYTWRAGYNGDVRMDLIKSEGAADDWLITPGITLDEAAMYRYTINVKTLTKGYPEIFEVLVGTDPGDLSTFRKVASEESFELYEAFGDYNADFFIDTPGRYFLALRYRGDKANNSTMMLLNSVSVSKIGPAKAPAGVTGLKITPGEDDAMSAEVSFTAPSEALDGGKLSPMTRINVYRNGAAEPVHTFSNPQNGASLSFNDTKVSKVGVNVYTVIGENEHGQGAAVADSAFIGIYSAPYLETFDVRTSADLYKSTVTGVAESNVESSKWKYNEYNQHLSFSAFNMNETEPVEVWLYTPKFKLDANSVYSFSYKANVNLYSETITNKVYMGAEATPESQSTQIGSMPRSTDYKKVDVSHNVVTTDEGKFYFGIHSVGTKQYDYLYADIDDVSLTYLKSAFSPYAFTDYKAEADKGGNLSVDMQFKAPATDYQGNNLTGYLKVEVYRGQSPTPVFTKEDIAPGAFIDWTDTQAQHGNNVYMIVAQNSYGRSEVLVDTVFAGRDVPMIIENLTCKGSADNNNAVLTWQAPSQGVNGGVVIGNELSYNVYSYNLPDNTLTLIKDGIKDRAYTVENEPMDEQKSLYYAVTAVNTEGESQAVATQVTLGKLYTLPFKESFAAKELSTTPWEVSTSNSYVLNWGVTNPAGASYNNASAQDDDGGVAYFYNGSYYEAFGGAAFISPKMTLGGGSAVLKFWVYNIATAYPDNKPVLMVYVRADDGLYELAAEYVVGSDTEDGWKQYEVPLSKYSGSSFINLAFYGFTGGNADVIYLDNIVVEKGDASSIGNASADEKPVSSIRYYDISGRELKSPRSGVCIRTVIYTDGTMKSEKIVMN